MISIKSDRELNLMRKAAGDSLAAQAVATVRPGISTGELDALAERIAREMEQYRLSKGIMAFRAAFVRR